MLKIILAELIAVAAAVAAAACGTTHQRATAYVPAVAATRVSITIERVSTRAFPTEYRRSVIIALDGREPVPTELFPDTGGYSRTNLYRLSDGTVFLRDAFESFAVDLTTGVVSKDEKRRPRAEFLGSFDVNDAGEWSFIPASNRADRPTEVAGGS